MIVRLKAEERKALEKLVRSGENKARVITRSRILLMADRNQKSHKTQEQIKQALEISNSTVSATCRRYAAQGLVAALGEKPRPGAKPIITGEVEARITSMVCSDPPQDHARWTLRLIQKELIRLEVVVTISHVAVGNVLKKMNLSLGG